MKLEELFREIKIFSEETHGSSDYDKDELFVKGEGTAEFAPLRYLTKKNEDIGGPETFLKKGFVYESYEFYTNQHFKQWFERQFSRKLLRKNAKRILIIQLRNNKSILGAIEEVNKCYEILRDNQILLNGKNLPVQLGEWFAKSIFGLKQVKSTSQRGFDFYLGTERVEIKVHWGDLSSPKGVKIRKTFVELSDYCVIVYLGTNFMIREICFLDSEYVSRRFGGKGHTIFLKDQDVSQYFFSKSSKHIDKVVNSNSLLKYANPTLAMNLAEKFQ